MIALILLIFFGTVGLFFFYFEFVEQEVNRGWSQKARQNPFLGSELFLEKQNKHVSSHFKLEVSEHLQENTTLIVGNSLHVVSQKRLDYLLQWVRSGGHLIVGGNSPDNDGRDLLLDTLNVWTYDTDCDCGYYNFGSDEVFKELFGEQESNVLKDGDEQEKDADKLDKEDAQTFNEVLKFARNFQAKKKLTLEKIQEYEAQVDARELTIVNMEGVKSDLEILFDPNTGLDHPSFSREPESEELVEDNVPFYWANSEYATHMLQIELGQGMVTVVSDISVWHSDKVARFDHAYLLKLLTSVSDKVVILYGAELPSLWELLRKYHWEVLVCFFIFLFLWLWHNLVRLGPIRVVDIQTRRALGEHIIAVSYFLWRIGKSNLLLNTLRRKTYVYLVSQYPNLRNAEPEEIAGFLHDKTGIESNLLQDSLFEGDSEERIEEEYFFKIVYTLHGLRKNI